MRIGILTLPLFANYGGILQAYALQTVLERMGHEVYHITKIWEPFSLPAYLKPFCYGKRIIKNLFGYKTPILYEKKCRIEQEMSMIYTSQFIDKYIKKRTYKNYSTILPYEYDAIVVGSDQIWRPIYFGINDIEQAYLKFAENWDIKRIAYAASFGTNEWEYTPEQTAKCCKLANQFNKISVRESSAVPLCQKHFNIKPEFVLDPTMLLNKKDYIELIYRKNDIIQKSGNLFYYILDETKEKKDLIEKIAIQRNLQPFKSNAKCDDPKAPITERIQPPIEDWLRGFMDAELVITDSFHGCVFSIIFNKPFIAICNKNRGQARFESLLNLFSLQNRLIDISSPSPIIPSEAIDWDNVNSTMKHMKENSVQFIIDNIS